DLWRQRHHDICPAKPPRRRAKGRWSHGHQLRDLYLGNLPVVVPTTSGSQPAPQAASSLREIAEAPVLGAAIPQQPPRRSMLRGASVTGEPSTILWAPGRAVSTTTASATL